MGLRAIEKYGPRIERVSAKYPWVGEMAGDVDREVAERYAELPVDAGGEPWRVGEAVEYPGGGLDEVRSITLRGDGAVLNERGWVPEKCRHRRKPTVEGWLRDAVLDVVEVSAHPGTGFPVVGVDEGSLRDYLEEHMDELLAAVMVE